jgi:cytochrome c nitrite reductase small subunit
LGTRERLLLLLVLGVGPAVVTLATYELSFRRAEQVTFCADCHTMTPWVDDLHNPKSKSLAAMHYDNRWILRDQCYTCHVDYGFLGPITTKLESLRHVAIYYSGIGMPRQIKLRKPFPNLNCLQCHGPAANFRNNRTHAAVMKPLLAGKLSCLTCHQPIHTANG